METRPVVPDRKLLARLVLIREEARNMMGGGLLDERNDRGFNTLPESEVCICAFIKRLQDTRLIHWPVSLFGKFYFKLLPSSSAMGLA